MAIGREALIIRAAGAAGQVGLLQKCLIGEDATSVPIGTLGSCPPKARTIGLGLVRISPNWVAGDRHHSPWFTPSDQGLLGLVDRGGARDQSSEVSPRFAWGSTIFPGEEAGRHASWSSTVYLGGGAGEGV